MYNHLLPILHAGLMLLAVLLFIPFAVFFLECVVAVLPSRKFRKKVWSMRPKTAVLVPAHNEASVIQATLKSLQPQLTNRDELVVIADNCTDNTAETARSLGVKVIERHEPNLERRGKGYALDFGLRYLATHPPDIVVTVDADCIAESGTLDRLVKQAHATQRPTQATYLMKPPANPCFRDQISALAVVIKNQVRPLGLSRLGCPVLLTGSGMAFPWSVISKISLAGSKTCDDMQSSIDLAIAGYPAFYCPNTQITGRLMKCKAAFSQRSRWEHGHLEMLTTEVPRLLIEAFLQRRLDLLALALEVAVPPLSLLVMGWAAVTGLAIADGWLGHFWLPIIPLTAEGLLLFIAILGGWIKFSKHELPLSQLLKAPLYALWKVPLYVAYLMKPQTRWIRTERD